MCGVIVEKGTHVKIPLYLVCLFVFHGAMVNRQNPI